MAGSLARSRDVRPRGNDSSVDALVYNAATVVYAFSVGNTIALFPEENPIGRIAAVAGADGGVAHRIITHATAAVAAVARCETVGAETTELIEDIVYRYFLTLLVSGSECVGGGCAVIDTSTSSNDTEDRARGQRDRPSRSPRLVCPARY